jgi:drug/metabolite transporter (DMT)-like permease
VVSRRARALGALIALMIVWGSTFVVTKAAVGEVPPLTLAAIRFVIAALVLVPIALARGGSGRLPRPLPLASLAVMGVTGIALFTVAFNYALVYGSAAQGALVFALVPAGVAIAAVVALRERPSRRRMAGIALSIAGVAAIVAVGKPDFSSPSPLLGALCMLGTVVAWAVYTVVAKRLAAADDVVVIAWATVLGAAMLLPLAAMELASSPWPRPSWQAWVGIAFLGVLASALAYVVYSYVLRELEASLIAAYLNLDPVIGVATAVVFLGETLTMGQVAGGAVAIAGMWLASVER